MAVQRQSYRPLTARQESVLRFTAGFIAKVGWPPSLREIADNFGIGTLRGVTVHLDALERKGYISRASTPRSIRILHPAYSPGHAATMVPLVNEHHTDLLAEWNVERLFPVSSKLLDRADGAFIVRIRGDAMAPAIMPRDLAVCVPQSAYSDRQLVAFANVVIGRTEGRDILVRTLYERIAGPVFVASRSDCPAIKGDYRILGKVVGLMRDYEGEAF